MDKITGWKTIIVAVTGLVAAIAGAFGYGIPMEQQAALSTGIMSIIMLGMRFVTKTPVLKDS